MPTRILDIGTVDDGSLDKLLRAPIKLVESAEIVSDRVYVCLSHRWGPPGENITSTQATLESHMIGMAFCDLGIVYQDTVHILRRLGVQYVWIDSLCIIQDSAKDWRKESQSMAKVYSHAHFTLARQCDSTRSLQMEQIPSYLVTETSVSPAIYARVQPIHVWSSRNFLPLFPLLSRGWIYQERLLSPRVVHFSEHEISWECNELSDCQCGEGTTYPDRVHSPKIYQTNALSSVGLTKTSATAALRKEWKRTVEEYSQLRLTIPSDRLHALQGCAEQMKAKLGDSYVFGHWAGGGFQDFFWHRNQSFRPDKRILGDICTPSWSWGSISTGVYFLRGPVGGPHVIYKEIKHDPCQRQTSTYMLVAGKVLPGWLTLGKVTRAEHAHRNPLQRGDEQKDKPDEREKAGERKSKGDCIEDPESENIDSEDSEDEDSEDEDSEEDNVKIGTFGQYFVDGSSSESRSWPRGQFFEDYKLQTEDWHYDTSYDIDLLWCGQDRYFTYLLVLWRYGKGIPGSGLHRETKEGRSIYQRIGVVCHVTRSVSDIDWSKVVVRTVAIE
jgi:hypothetical protein